MPCCMNYVSQPPQSSQRVREVVVAPEDNSASHTWRFKRNMIENIKKQQKTSQLQGFPPKKQQHNIFVVFRPFVVGGTHVFVLLLL